MAQPVTRLREEWHASDDLVNLHVDWKRKCFAHFLTNQTALGQTVGALVFHCAGGYHRGTHSMPIGEPL